MTRFLFGWIPKNLAPIIAVLTAATVILTAITVFFGETLYFRMMMIWNIFLSGVPLAFVGIFCVLERRGKHAIAKTCCALGWLLFFPNAPYMLTDFIHLGNYRFWNGTAFTANPVVWFALFHSVAGILVGCLFGMLSFWIMHGKLEQKHGKTTGWIFVLFVSLLSGFAIWVGRCLRFNSWDLFRPVTLVRKVAEQYTSDVPATIFLFAGMTFFVYVPLYSLLAKRKGEIA
ncbi:MAG: DUF1361 domain-containing protein [Oscillospiraceae bacterium]|jgi:uncharacterized membrane protein|nr:DUF1361 domain-containing protein [Oscillospiraceae bacterium]